MDLCENQNAPREPLTAHCQVTGNKDLPFTVKLSLNVNKIEVKNTLNI